MLKRRGKNFQQIYRNPLPITLSVDAYGHLPPVTALNPLSWFWLAWRLVSVYGLSLSTELPVSVDLVRNNSDEPVFTISDQKGMMRLWQLGFFGKGTLSRSEPSWKGRIEQRLGLVDSDNTMTREDVTSTRRDERKLFKSLRHEVQKFEELARLRLLSNEEQKEYDEAIANLEAIKLKRDVALNNPSELKSMNDGGRAKEGHSKEEIKGPKEENSVPNEVTARNDNLVLRTEDLELIDEDTNALKKNIETLQLQKVEVLFLQFALGAVLVTEGNRPLLLDDLFHACLGSNRLPDNKFILDYVVYHHYRSLGWCARSGLKFGCDMLLYKRGPPMLHAEYSVLVVPDGKCGWVDWQDFMALARVVGGVRKTLILAFVEVPTKTDFDKILLAKINKQSLEGLLKLYKVTEVVYKRWSPSRTRD